MFPYPKQKQLVKPTLARFVEDRLNELEMSYEELVAQMGVERILLTRRVNDPCRFDSELLRQFMRVLRIEAKDFWNDLYLPYGIGRRGLYAEELEQIVQEGGHELGRVNFAA